MFPYYMRVNTHLTDKDPWHPERNTLSSPRSSQGQCGKRETRRIPWDQCQQGLSTEKELHPRLVQSQEASWRRQLMVVPLCSFSYWAWSGGCYIQQVCNWLSLKLTKVYGISGLINTAWSTPDGEGQPPGLMHLQCHGFGPPCCISQDATFEEPNRKDFSGDLHHTEPYGLQMAKRVSWDKGRKSSKWPLSDLFNT